MKRQRNQVNEAQKSNKVPLEPKNLKQREYLNALREYDQVFAIGPAGSGKTYIPTVYATKLYLTGQIKKIALSRPAVAVEEEHGFLPGDIHKKLAPWALPVTEIVQEIVGKDVFYEMLKCGDFEVAPFAYMRGRTFNGAFVMLDEAQNVTPRQMQMFLTRLGEGSRVVVSGDLRQCDLRGGSGLELAVRLAKKHQLPVKIVEFSTKDIVRSGLTQMWVSAFEDSQPK